MPWRWVIAGALAIYCLWGVLLIAQKPGLQYDEALLVLGAIDMRHSAAETDLPHDPHTWVCPFHRCFPLMSARYVGSVKEFLALPLFGLFGPRASVVRLLSLMLGSIGIWGLAKLVGEQAGWPAAAAVALILAINPAFLAMVVFDNGTVSAMMAALGLVCAALAAYLKRNSVTAALWLGLAAGFGIWTRANFVWILAAAVGAGLIVFRRRLLIPLSHMLAIAAGGVAGSLAFIVYQVVSKGGTYEALNLLTARQPLSQLLSFRIFYLAEILLSDGEHRVMWAMRELPAWQLWLFPAAVLAGCAVCLAAKRPAARFAALTFLFLGAFLFLSRLQVAEHHLIAMLPLGAVVVVLASSSILTPTGSWSRALPVSLAVVYAGSALYWQAAAVRGLRNTGGIGPWSDAVTELARHLEQAYPNRELKILDWGLQNNLYVLTDGRIRTQELFWGASEQLSDRGRPWADEIREGGIFLLNGPANRQIPAASTGFLRALDVLRPATRRYAVAQRSGDVYAQVIEIEPNSNSPLDGARDRISSSLSTADPASDSQLTGFYGIENGWRWTKREFSMTLGVPDSNGRGAFVSVELHVPALALERVGPLTLTARLGDHRLASQTYENPGNSRFAFEVPAAGVKSGQTRIDFALDKVIPPSQGDVRELGIVVLSASATAK